MSGGFAKGVGWPPTGRQLAVLVFARRHRDALGYGPTLREVGMHMGIRSTNGVNDHRRALVRKGFLRDDSGLQARCGFLLTPLGEEASTAEIARQEGNCPPAVLKALQAGATPPLVITAPIPRDLRGMTDEHAGLLAHLAPGFIAWCQPNGACTIGRVHRGT